MGIHPTYMAEIVHRVPSNLRYCDASGVRAGGLWVEPNEDGFNRVWRIQWPEDVTDDLVNFDNPKRAITNSDLEVANLVLQESVFPHIRRDPAYPTPTSGSDNTPTAAWAFREADTTKPILANLRSIRSDHNRNHRITQSVLYHPSELNTMADDASRRFDLSPNRFLAFFLSTYLLKSPGLWQL